MDLITDEFVFARTGEPLEIRLKNSDSFRQQMKSLHEAAKDFTVEKRDMALLIEVEDELHNIKKCMHRFLRFTGKTCMGIILYHIKYIIQSDKLPACMTVSGKLFQCLIHVMQFILHLYQ